MTTTNKTPQITTAIPDLEQLHDDAEVALDRWLASQLEFQRTCEVHPATEPGTPCGKPATWLQICRTCDHTVAMCDVHHDDALKDGANPHIQKFICVACKTEEKKRSDLVDFIQIGPTE